MSTSLTPRDSFLIEMDRLPQTEWAIRATDLISEALIRPDQTFAAANAFLTMCRVDLAALMYELDREIGFSVEHALVALGLADYDPTATFTPVIPGKPIATLPEIVTIFRGVRGRGWRNAVFHHSWALNVETACYFAVSCPRYAPLGRPLVVLAADVPRDAIAYIMRTDDTVLLRNNLKEVLQPTLRLEGRQGRLDLTRNAGPTMEEQVRWHVTDRDRRERETTKPPFVPLTNRIPD